MKKSIQVFLLLFCFCSYGIAQESKGIRFEALSLKEALAKAEQTGKKVFIDCYTKTCGPCKYMAKYIFPLEECGTYFNHHYVCLMRDMQEGEGIEIAQKYRVRIYPTFLILNPDGSLYCCMEGGAVSKPEDDFVGKVKDAVRLSEMNRAYEAGKLSGESMQEYITLLRRKDKRQLERVLNDQMPPLGVEALSEPKNWQIIREEVTDYGSRLFRYLLENRKAFEKKVGEEEVESKIVSVYRNHFRIVKRMCKNFRQPISDLKTLEKEGYPEVKALHYCMLFREIINSEGSGRTREIISALKKLPREFPDAKERRQIAEELTGIEKIATPTQLAEIRRLKANL